jgi:hypothetical protein
MPGPISQPRERNCSYRAVSRLSPAEAALDVEGAGADEVLEVDPRFQVGGDGSPAHGTDRSAIRVVQSHMEDILALLDEPELQIFNAPPWPNRES